MEGLRPSGTAILLDIIFALNICCVQNNLSRNNQYIHKAEIINDLLRSFVVVAGGGCCSEFRAKVFEM